MSENELRDKIRESLVTAAEIMIENARVCVESANNQIARLRAARTSDKAVEAGSRIFDWIEHIREERQVADDTFAQLLGKIWRIER